MLSLTARSSAREEVETLRSQLESGLQSNTKLALHPTRVSVYTLVDALDQEAWRILLVLPFPTTTYRWEQPDVYATRRAAIDGWEALIRETELELPGQTLALISTDDAPQSEIAIDENDDE